MTQLLITSQQVIDLAFAANEKITPVSIKETKIDAAQEKYIRPVLGKLYDALVAGKYPELLKDYIQPALAYYVRYSSIPDLALKLNDKGRSFIPLNMRIAQRTNSGQKCANRRRTMQMPCSTKPSDIFLRKRPNFPSMTAGKIYAIR